jgi:hypothetical protein
MQDSIQSGVGSPAVNVLLEEYFEIYGALLR